MPKLKFTDTEIDRMPLTEKQTWYTHTTDKYSGLRLCISKSSKTFYLNKWDPVASKARQFKLGRFSRSSYTVTMAWHDAQAKAADVDAGRAMNRDEQAVADALAEAENRKHDLPTLTEAVNEYVRYMTTLPEAVAKAMTIETAEKYRRAVAKYLAEWKDTPINDLPTLAIRDHLDQLQRRIPYGAMYVHTAIGATIRWQNKRRDLDLKIPGVTKVTKTARARVDRSLDWSDRWAEIEAIENASIKAAWKFRWLTGIRVEAFLPRTWEDVNWEFGSLSLPQDKRHPPRVVALADAALDVLRELHDIRESDEMRKASAFIFYSAKADHIYDKLDRLPSTTARELRHLWHDAAEAVEIRPIVEKWLAGQIERDIRGHYTQPPLDRQRDAANRIAEYVISRSTSTPKNIVVLDRTSP